MLRRFLKIFVVLVALSITGGNTVRAQNEAAIKTKIENKRYVFIPQSVSPMQGNVRQLTPDYELRVLPDSIICSLPYFGRAYSAPIGSSQAGLNFISTDFSYTSTARKKGGWDIILKPAKTDVQQLFLTVFENGSATLRVFSTNRQAISFNGNISASR